MIVSPAVQCLKSKSEMTVSAFGSTTGCTTAIVTTSTSTNAGSRTQSHFDAENDSNGIKLSSSADHSQVLNLFSHLMGNQFALKAITFVEDSAAALRGSKLYTEGGTGAHMDCFLGRLVDGLIRPACQAAVPVRFELSTTDKLFVDFCCFGFQSSDQLLERQTSGCWDGVLHFTISLQVGKEGAATSAMVTAW